MDATITVALVLCNFFVFMLQ